MSQVAGGDTKSPQALLHVLCSKVTGLNEDALTPYYKLALSIVGSTIVSPAENDEFEVAEKIKKKLVRQRRERDAARFTELHRKIQGQDFLKNRWALLCLFLKLSDDKQGKSRVHTPAFIQTLPTHATSTPFLGRDVTPVTPSTLHSSGISSGISSIHASARSDSSIMPHSLAPSGATPFRMELLNRRPPASLRLMNSMDRSHKTGVSEKTPMPSRTLASAISRSSTMMTADDSDAELPESVLLREIVYTFQGIEGQFIRLEGGREGFRIDPKAPITKSTRRVLGKLAECGWLYNKVRKYADSRSTDRAFGLVGQSFCAALHQELTEYYRLIAVLDAQLQQEEDQGVSVFNGGLTLRRLAVWSCDPLVRLKTLAALVDVCQGKKGGALASAIHSYTHHGDPSIQGLVKHTLVLVSQPVFSTVLRWIYDGELEDTYHEFFVASDPTVKDDRLWHDKYSLRKSMIPSFLDMEQAKKILLTGKSINFLRQVCHDRTSMRNRDVVKKAQTHQVESIFSHDLDGVFRKMIDTIYHETSHHLLEVLHTKYKFMEHLKAMRRYLLLGQGDFIRHLMDLLEEDLAKPAATLFLHNLTGILETAIRGTNAQYDDADILKRLDVRLLEVSPGDTGWDVFSLDYHVDGPIRTVFTPESMIMYLRVFNFLWRAKRMEYILAGIWKGQMANNHNPKALTELSGVFHQCHIIAGEMVHFVQQVQYYINFEVLECSWDALLTRAQEAEDLDHIIAAHNDFLTTVTARALLDPQSTDILAQLRTIFDLIIQFQSKQDTLYQTASDEIHARQVFEEKQQQREENGQWGVTQKEQDAEEVRRSQFLQTTLPQVRSQLRVLHQSYQNMVQKFLFMLTCHSDVSLRFLSFRLDFNETYKAKDPKLFSPSAFHKTKRRTSVPT